MLNCAGFAPHDKLVFGPQETARPAELGFLIADLGLEISVSKGFSWGEKKPLCLTVSGLSLSLLSLAESKNLRKDHGAAQRQKFHASSLWEIQSGELPIPPWPRNGRTCPSYASRLTYERYRIWPQLSLGRHFVPFFSLPRDVVDKRAWKLPSLSPILSQVAGRGEMQERAGKLLRFFLQNAKCSRPPTTLPTHTLCRSKFLSGWFVSQLVPKGAKPRKLFGWKWR